MDTIIDIKIQFDHIAKIPCVKSDWKNGITNFEKMLIENHKMQQNGLILNSLSCSG